MNHEKLNAIKERVVNTTPGPWTWTYEGVENLVVVQSGTNEIVARIDESSEDMTFITHAREDVPALVAEVERLQTELAKTKECYEIIEKAAFKASYKMCLFKSALEKIMEDQAPIMEGWETTTYEIARKALGGDAHE